MTSPKIRVISWIELPSGWRIHEVTQTVEYVPYVDCLLLSDKPIHEITRKDTKLRNEKWKMEWSMENVFRICGGQT